MVGLIVGKEGKGKTKQLLDRVNEDIKEASGNIVYLDRSTKHMFELNNRVRLVNVGDYNFENSSEFIGFVYGIISQDHDMQKVYIDGIMKVAKLNIDEVTATIKRLEEIGKTHDVDFIMSISANKEDLDPSIQENIIVAL